MEDFIPDALFSSIPSIWILLGIVAIAIGVLVHGADLLIDAAAKLARQLGVGEIIIGATIVSLGTTAPEATVSVMAAWGGKPGLALGNAIGSIICDTALVFGLACSLSSIRLDHYLLNRQGWVQFGSGALLAALCYGAWVFTKEAPVLGREVGVFFLGLLVFYIYYSMRWAKKHEAQIQHDDATKAEEAAPKWKSLLWIGIGVLLVLVGSRFLIGSVTELAIRWEVPKGIIASTLVAFGTSVPELATGLRAIAKGHTDLLLGNVIGADILNVLFVVGASAAAAPIEVPPEFLTFHIPAMLFTLLLFRIYIAISRETFQRWMGVSLLLLYVGFIVVQYTTQFSE